MEDFSPVRASEQSEISALQSEWLQKQDSSEKLVLAGAKSGGKSGDGPGKDAADRLDRELTQFAGADLPGASAHMKEFQKLVGNFEQAADKKEAVKEFGPAAAKLKVTMGNEAGEIVKKIDAETEKIPGRKALDAEYSARNGKFFDQAGQLPSREYERVLNLLEWKDGESASEHANRVRDGLKNNPRLLKSYNDAESAREKVEASKTPLEKQLEEQHRRDISEIKTIKMIVNKVAIRSEIEAS